MNIYIYICKYIHIYIYVLKEFLFELKIINYILVMFAIIDTNS